MSVQIRNTIWGITELETFDITHKHNPKPQTVHIKSNTKTNSKRPFKTFIIQLDDTLFLDYQITDETEAIPTMEKNKFKKPTIPPAKKEKNIRVLKPDLKTFEHDLSVKEYQLNGLSFGGILNTQPNDNLVADFYLDFNDQAWYKKDLVWHLIKNELEK